MRVLVFCLLLVPIVFSITCSDNEELDCVINPKCEVSCGNPDAGQLGNCGEDCGRQMCRCADGYLRHDGKCIAVEDCPTKK